MAWGVSFSFIVSGIMRGTLMAIEGEATSEPAEVEDHTGHRVRLSLKGHFEYVVVSVAVRVGRGAVHRPVLFVAQGGNGADVRSRKIDAAGDEHAPIIYDARRPAADTVK